MNLIQSTPVIGSFLISALLGMNSFAAPIGNPVVPVTPPTPPAPATATPAPMAPNIAGTYQCKSYFPATQKNFQNPLTIIKNGDAYTFQWMNSTGYPIQLGTGVMTPDSNNSVAVVFWDAKKPDTTGVELFIIKPDGSLAATWAMQGDNRIGTENCTKG